MCELISNDNETFFPGGEGKCEEQGTRDGWHYSKHFEGEQCHEDISGYRAHAGVCLGEGGLV